MYQDMLGRGGASLLDEEGWSICPTGVLSFRSNLTLKRSRACWALILSAWLLPTSAETVSLPRCLAHSLRLGFVTLLFNALTLSISP